MVEVAFVSGKLWTYLYEALFSWCTSVSKACFVFYWLWAGSFSQRIKISNLIDVTGHFYLDILHPAGGQKSLFW